MYKLLEQILNLFKIKEPVMVQNNYKWNPKSPEVRIIEPDSKEYKEIIKRQKDLKSKDIFEKKIPIPDNYIPLLRDIYKPKIKEELKTGKNLDKTIEDIEHTYGIKKETIEEMIKKYYNKKKSYDSKNTFEATHYSNKILPKIIEINEVKNYETKFEIINSAKNDIEDNLKKFGIYYDELSKEEFETLRYFTGRIKKPNLKNHDIKDLEKKLGFDKNKNNKAKKLKAALYYSNLLQEFYKPSKDYLKEIDNIKVENKQYNNLAQISLLMGLKSTTIRYWTKKLESDPNIQKLKEKYITN